MLDIHRLVLLRELSLHGTIAAAARARSLTPSAVSQQLALLQREAGAVLLVRDGRRLVLTEAARVLVAHTERVLAELESAHAAVAALEQSVAGVVRLGAFPTAASALAAPAIAACQREHQDLQVNLDEHETSEGIAALKAGRLDALLVYEYSILPKVADQGIEMTPLIIEALLAAVPVGLRLPRGRLPVAALAGQRWVAPDSDTALRTALERSCALAGFAPDLAYTSDDYTVILALVEAGLGVSLVPQLALEGASTGVRLRALAGAELSRAVSVAIRAGSGRNPAVAALVASLRGAAEALRLRKPTR